MFAALPMYDHPEVRGATDALWAAIRDALRLIGVDAPEQLTRDGDHVAQWRRPDLLLGQICGLPYRQEFHRTRSLIGAIDYGLPDTPPGFYHSHFVARLDDPRNSVAAFDGARLAFNEALSHSGWATAAARAVRFVLQPETGSHRASVDAVAAGRADIAAIDAISWRLIRQNTTLADGLKIVGRSESTPGQALVTAFPALAPALRHAIPAGIAALGPTHRRALGSIGFAPLGKSAYLSVPNPPSPQAYSAVHRERWPLTQR